MEHAHLYALLSILVSGPALKAGLNGGPWAQGRKADLLQAPDLARGCHTWAGWHRSSNRPVLMLLDERMHRQQSTIFGPHTADLGSGWLASWSALSACQLVLKAKGQATLQLQQHL